jgi:hypothetical protein
MRGSRRDELDTVRPIPGGLVRSVRSDVIAAPGARPA